MAKAVRLFVTRPPAGKPANVPLIASTPSLVMMRKVVPRDGAKPLLTVRLSAALASVTVPRTPS